VGGTKTGTNHPEIAVQGGGKRKWGKGRAKRRRGPTKKSFLREGLADGTLEKKGLRKTPWSLDFGSSETGLGSRKFSTESNPTNINNNLNARDHHVKTFLLEIVGTSGSE